MRFLIIIWKFRSGLILDYLRQNEAARDTSGQVTRIRRKGSEWVVGGYNEIQSPRRKCVFINHEKLANLAGYDFYDSFRESHKKWVNESLSNGSNVRDRQGPVELEKSNLWKK